jgi:hypothetical protein
VGPQTYIRTSWGEIGTKSSLRRVLVLYSRMVVMGLSSRTGAAGLPHIYLNENDMDDGPREISQAVIEQQVMHIVFVMPTG